MVWNSFDDFLHMGGYALYVWGSVVVTFGLMTAERLTLGVRRKSIKDQLAQQNIDAETLGDERLNEEENP